MRDCTIKLVYEGDIRRIPIEVLTWDDLTQKVRDFCKLDVGEYRVKYIDNDGDSILIDSTGELLVAMDLMPPGATLKLMVEKIKVTKDLPPSYLEAASHPKPITKVDYFVNPTAPPSRRRTSGTLEPERKPKGKDALRGQFQQEKQRQQTTLMEERGYPSPCEGGYPYSNGYRCDKRDVKYVEKMGKKLERKENKENKIIAKVEKKLEKTDSKDSKEKIIAKVEKKLERIEKKESRIIAKVEKRLERKCKRCVSRDSIVSTVADKIVARLSGSSSRSQDDSQPECTCTEYTKLGQNEHD